MASPTSLTHSPSRRGGTTPPMAPAPDSAAPVAARTPPAKVLTLSALALPVSLGISATSLLLPTAAADLGIATGTATWLLTVYGWGMAVGTPLMAAVAERLGRRRALAAGSALLLLGALLVLTGPALPVLVVGRAALAAGAGAMVVLALGIARDIPQSGPRQRTLGVIAAGIGISGAAGPLVGSSVADLTSWRFALALPALSLLAAPALARHTAKSAVRSVNGPRDRADVAGAALLTSVVTAVFLVLQGSAAGLSGGVLALVSSAGLAAAVALALRVRARRDGFLPMPIVRDRRFLISSAFILSLTTVNFALVYTAPQLLADRTGWTRSQIGALLVPSTLVGAVLSLAMAGMALRLGARRAVLVLAVTAAAGAGVAGLAPGVALVLLGGAAGAFAAAAAQGLLVAAATSTLPGPLQTRAIGLFNLAFQFGSVVGPAVVVMLSPALGTGPALALVALGPLAAGALSRAASSLPDGNQTV